MHYRPEIDGLRALAIVPVVLFHAELAAFSGGFVGVDVFFVISGYLITGIIVTKCAEGHFSLLYFYERRARRILPALLFVFACILPLGWYWMIPSQLQALGDSMLSSLVFSSNIYFWQNTGYFGQAAEELPLLHTWSLAVEEQFYVVFPLAVLALWKFGRKALLAVMAGGFIISLAMAEYASHAMPNAGFFLAPTRGWELLIGSILALVSRDRLIGSTTLNQALSVIGLLLISIAVFLFDRKTPFPGLYALVPTLGAAAIIVFATPQTIIGRLLSMKPVVGVGLISYSLYLWHQPMLAFARIRLQAPLDDMTIALLLSGAVGAAYLSWRFVERPFRSPNRISAKRLVVTACGSTAVLAGLCIILWSTKGLEQQFEDRFGGTGQALSEAIGTGGERAIFSDGDCRFWVRTTDEDLQSRFDRCHASFGKAVLVVGDSHAMDLYNAIYLNTEYPFIVSIAKGGCRPDDLSSSCPFAGIQDFVLQNAPMIDSILFTQSGSYFLDDDRQVDLSAISRTSSYVSSLAVGPGLVWIGPQVETGIDLRRLHPKYGLEPHPDEALVQALGEADRAIARLAAKTTDYSYFSKIESIGYDHDRDFMISGQYTYSDIDHWSTLGEQVFGERMIKDLRSLGLLTF